MAKSKNHTAANQNKKAHRNGIKKPKKERYGSTRGVDAKFLRNQRFAKLSDPVQNKSLARKLITEERNAEKEKNAPKKVVEKKEAAVVVPKVTGKRQRDETVATGGAAPKKEKKTEAKV